MPTSFCYLASTIDEYSRDCLGWSLSRWINTRLILSALQRAVEARSAAAGLMHPCDQAVQYASREYVGTLEEIGARISMAAAVGNPYQNA